MSTHDPSRPGAPQPTPGSVAPPPGPPAPGAYPPAYPPAPPPRDPRTKSWLLACVLSCMPGLGQIYVGYYQRGFVHALVVAGLIAILNVNLPSGLAALFGMFLAFFWLYNIIDAGRRAVLYNEVLAGSEAIELPSDLKEPSFAGSILGGLVLIGVGAILLSNTLWDVPLDWLEDWWPVAPILLGVYLIARALHERAGGSESS